MKKKSESGSCENKILREIGGVLLIAAGIIMFISLVSHQSQDGMASILGSGYGNLAGRAGAFLSRGLFAVLGLPAFLFPIFTLMAGLNCLLPQESLIKKQRLWGLILGLISFCSLLAIVNEPPLNLGNLEIDLPGGLIGDMSGKLILLPLFNFWGAAILTAALFLISIMLTTGISLRGILERLLPAGPWIFDKLKNYALTLIEELKSKKEAASEPVIINNGKKKESKPIVEYKDEELLQPQPEPVISTPAITSPPAAEKKKGKAKEVEEQPLDLTPLIEAEPGSYIKPDLSLLETPKHTLGDERKGLLEQSKVIESKLKDFSIEGRISHVCQGPVITRYELEPAPGIKINKISNLADDLALALKATAIRIVAPIPGKAAVGIEVPNKKRQTIYLREIFEDDHFQKNPSSLTLALGKDTEGNPYATDLGSMPHLLIAGATGSGKSVTLNAIICSILYKASPSEVRFVMVDPKMLELGIYNGIPHLLGPVVTNPKKAAAVLLWATREMEERYQTLSEVGVRNIDQYNSYVLKNKPKSVSELEEEPRKPLPYIVIIIDEFADLMLMAAKEIEGSITRLAQMARAVGIHLIVATQRPSVDVITGIIKANFPCRIAFRVASKIDSRTILDSMGAEKLLGKGDMLFVPPHTSVQERIHGAMVSEQEVKAIVDFLTSQGHETQEPSWAPSTDYEDMVINSDDSESGGFEDEYDEFYDQAVDIVVKTGQASISMIQRKLRIGYNRSARMVEIMEKDGIVGPAIAGRPREVLVKPQEEML